ncbi:alcohol dehydrogenase [Rhodotorula toruloides]|uniref:Alcohol dehydrogenase n=1 Tax=Rhodotorula toruloides TaxID=5286 RepID=A0A511KPQ9_RHOTO|nr:alcohol dehydrogenase [Rhodotorula toruloides]
MSPNLPKTYRAAFVVEKGKPLEIRDASRPPLVEYKSPKSGHIVVKVLASGVCHSDSIVVDQVMPTGLPRVPGHEIVGDVVEVPEDEKRWKVGDRVGSGWHGGHCDRGDFVTCDNENINGIITDGGHAEYVTLRTEAVCSIPRDIDPAKAAPLLCVLFVYYTSFELRSADAHVTFVYSTLSRLAFVSLAILYLSANSCAGMTTFNSIRNMDVHPGDVVAIQGLGGLGHLGIQFANRMGFKTVAVSRGPEKKDFATKLGAHVYIDSNAEDPAEALQKLGGAKVIAAVAPSGKAMEQLIGGLAVNGQLLTLAVADKLEVPIMTLIQKRASIRGWPSGSAADSEDTVKFAQMSGVECMVEEYPLDKVNEAFNSMMEGKARFRSVLVFK